MIKLPPFDKIGVTPTPDFVNASPSAGITGSIVNGEIFNALQDEMQNAVSATGLTPTDSDYTQITQSFLFSGIFIGTFGGTSDALTATIPGSVTIPALKAGMRVSGFVTAANTTTTPSLAVAGFTTGSAPASVVRRGGAAPAIGDLTASLTTFRFDGTYWRIDGLTPSDISSGGSSVFNSHFAHGECQLVCASSSTITLRPKNGNNLIVGGIQQQIPGAGLSVGTSSVYVNGTANGNLSASTAYYVSVANISGTPTLRFWNAAAYGHAPDTTTGNVGVEVITSGGSPVQTSGVSTDALVGLVYVNASSQFSDTDGARYTLSWFNRTFKRSRTSFSVDRSTTSSGTLVEINAEIRNGFISWSDEVVAWRIEGYGGCPGVALGNGYNGGNSYMAAGAFDGTSPEPTVFVSGGGLQGGGQPINLESYKTGLSEGSAHYFTLLAETQTGTLTFYIETTYAAGLYQSPLGPTFTELLIRG